MPLYATWETVTGTELLPGLLQCHIFAISARAAAYSRRDGPCIHKRHAHSGRYRRVSAPIKAGWNRTAAAIVQTNARAISLPVLKVPGGPKRAIGEAIARSDIKKQYYLETRGDVLLRHKEVFRFWKKLGLEYIFLGIEAIDEEGLQKLRKRATLGSNFEALEFARSLGIYVLINLIADPRMGP